MTRNDTVPDMCITYAQVGDNASSPPAGILIHFQGGLMINIPGERVSVENMLTRMFGEFRARY